MDNGNYFLVKFETVKNQNTLAGSICVESTLSQTEEARHLLHNLTSEEKDLKTTHIYTNVESHRVKIDVASCTH